MYNNFKNEVYYFIELVTQNVNTASTEAFNNATTILDRLGIDNMDLKAKTKLLNQFDNIKTASEMDQKKLVFSNLKLHGDKITVFNNDKNYSYTLCKNQIEQSDTNYYIKTIALLLFEKLPKYLNDEISLDYLSDINVETQPLVKNLLQKKNTAIEQLKLLHKYRNLTQVQDYIEYIYNKKYTSSYVKYIIDKYYYNLKNIPKTKKNGLEIEFGILFH